MNQTITTPRFSTTFQIRLDKALKEIRKAGIVARRNVHSCCRSCYDPQIAENQPIIWHFGGQGNRISFDDDSVRYLDGSRTDSFYLNHSNLVTDEGDLTTNGEIVLAVFAKHGITVSWDKSRWSCIEVKVDESI